MVSLKKITAATILLVTCLATQPTLAASCQEDANFMSNYFRAWVTDPQWVSGSLEDYYGNPISVSEAIRQTDALFATVVSNSDGTCTLTAYGETTTWQAGHPLE